MFIGNWEVGTNFKHWTFFLGVWYAGSRNHHLIGVKTLCFYFIWLYRKNKGKGNETRPKPFGNGKK